MQYLTDKKLYADNETLYSVLSDFVNDLQDVEVEDVTPTDYVQIHMSDCYLDSNGDLFTPMSYIWVANKDPEDEQFIPRYSKEPTLTKLEIANLIAEYDDVDLNNPANFEN